MQMTNVFADSAMVSRSTAARKYLKEAENFLLVKQPSSYDITAEH